MPAEASARGLALLPELSGIVSPQRVSVTPPDRRAYARDLWPRGLLGLRSGVGGGELPDAIAWPESTGEVQALIRFAVANRVPVVPFGAGSGVCGGTLARGGGLVVDVKRMRRLLELDRAHLTATFEAGILGEHLEHELNHRGFTLGHFPSSIMCSTLGGWLAARSAGQCSSRYGKIEDMVRAVELVDGNGRIIDTSAPSFGPSWNQLLVGSEGTLGIFTRATVAVQPLPPRRLLRGYAMPRVSAGCEAIRRVMQRGLRPAVVRLYDELDTLMARPGSSRDKAPTEGASLDGWLKMLLGAEGRQSAQAAIERRLVARALARPGLLNRAVQAVLPRLGGGCLLIVGVEGDPFLAEAEAEAVSAEVLRAGGRDLGPEPGERWLAHRYDVSFKMSKIFDAGGFVDTMEVATTWDRLLDLYRSVKEALSPLAFVMAHFSHAYPEGCSIYFTFAAAAADEPTESEQRYDGIWRTALTAATRAGATISHHHGVGLSKAAFMPVEHGEALAVLGALKDVLDPHRVMNPGKLGL